MHKWNILIFLNVSTNEGESIGSIWILNQNSRFQSNDDGHSRKLKILLTILDTHHITIHFRYQLF